MQCSIVGIAILGVVSTLSIAWTTRSMINLLQRHVNRFSYLVDNRVIVFIPYTLECGLVTYDIFVDGMIVKVTRPRLITTLHSQLEDEFRKRMIKTVIMQPYNKHVSFSQVKLVQDIDVDKDGRYLFKGFPYYINTNDKVISQRR